MRFIKRYMSLCCTILAVFLGCAVWGLSNACMHAGKQQAVHTYVSPTQSIALEGEVEGTALHINVKPQEELEELTDASGKPYAQAGSVSLPLDATEVSVDFMRQFSAVASQITTITLGDGVQALGDAYFSEDQQAYIGVFNGFTSLQSVTMPNVEVIGSYAFSGCSSLTTVTTQVENLTLNNFSISNTNTSLQIVDANLVEVTFNGTWGTVSSGSNYTGGITQNIVRILPYEQIEYITFSDAVYLGEQAVIGCSSLKVVDVRSAVALSGDNIDILQTNPIFLLSSYDLSLVGNPLNLDAVDQVETVEEMIVLYKNMYTSLYVQIDAPLSDLQYFELQDINAYISEDSTAPYMHVLNKNNTQTIFFDTYYTYNNYSITNSSGESYLRYFTPTRNVGGYLESDVTTLYIPASFGKENIDYIQGNFFDVKAKLFTGEEVDAYQNITKLIVSGGYKTMGVLWDIGALLTSESKASSPMPNLKTLVFADGIEQISYGILDDVTPVEEVWLSNTVKLYTEGDRRVLGVSIHAYATKFYMHEGGSAEVRPTADNSAIVSLDGSVLYMGNTYASIPEGVVTIATLAMAGSRQAPQEYHLAESVRFIENSAFYGTPIQHLYLSDNVIALDSWAFFNMESLKTVHIGSGLQNIGQGNFSLTSSGETCLIEELYIDKQAPITTIPNDFLKNAENLTNLQLSDNIQTIGNNCFTNHNLSGIILPANLVSLGNNCFDTGAIQGDSNTYGKVRYIDLMNLPVHVNSLGTSVFNGCYFNGYLIMMDSAENYPENNALLSFFDTAPGDMLNSPVKSSQVLYQTTPTDIERNYIWYEGLHGIWENTTNPALMRIGETYYHRSLEFTEYTLTEQDVVYELTEDGTGIVITQFNSSAQNKDYVRIPDRFTELPIVEIRITNTSYILEVAKGVKLPDTLKIIGEGSFQITYGSIFEIPAGVEQIANNFVGHMGKGISNFVVSPDNQHFQAIDGVLATKGGEYVDLVALTADLFVPEGIQRITNIMTPSYYLMGSLYISSTVEYIIENEDAVFLSSLVNAISSIEVDPENKWYSSGNGGNYIKEKATNKLIFACENTVLDNSFEMVNFYAYMGIASIDYLYIPDSVTRVYGWITGFGSSIKHIRMSANVTSLSEVVLGALMQLGVLEIPNNSIMTEISGDIFKNTIFKMIIVPETITSISKTSSGSRTLQYLLTSSTTSLPTLTNITATYKYVSTTPTSGDFYPIDEALYGSRVTRNGAIIRVEQYDGSFMYYKTYTGS